MTQHENVCIRCGKIRIVGKTWTEQIAGSIVTYTATVCPDSGCQKIVDEQLNKKRDRIETIQKESAKRRESFRKNRSKTAKKKKIAS